MKTILFFLCFYSTVACVSSQTAIDVYESTLKVGAMGEETYYCGLAAGDQLIFNFEEVKGKELKEIEIIEYPSASKFMDYKTSKIVDKKLTIVETGIYKFRFANSALTGRICKFKIQRIPASEATKNFNCSVFWSSTNDTTFYTETEKYLIKVDTIVSNITDQIAKVHSQGNMNGNKTTFNFLLPKNTVSWSYYVGVDQAGDIAFKEATSELAKNAAPMLLKFSGYGPLAALALGGASYIAKLQAGEDIDFYIVDNYNINLLSSGAAFNYYKKGKVINDFSRMTAPLSGMLHFYFSNDNAITGVSVTVKVTAIVVNEEWGKREVQKFKIHSKDVPYLKS